jgi:hypothetical protein
MVSTGAFLGACRHEKSAADTIQPVRQYFEKQAGGNVVAPDLGSIEGTSGKILTWKVAGSDPAQFTEYSWVLAKNTDQLKKALVMFDSARAWNTETYIFLPVSPAALQVHEKVGLSVPKTIFDEDGMNRIRELVLSGKAPEGGFVDQVNQFMN